MHLPRRLIFGCGYLGRRVARCWISAGHAVAAITRSEIRALDLARDSITPIVADVTQFRELPLVDHLDVVLFAVGFDRTNHQSFEEVYVDGFSKVLGSLAKSPPKRLVYISSTGVYGNSLGDWVTEDSTCQPEREGGQACLAAEKLLDVEPWRERSLILRLAGIYGPGRLPNQQALLEGKPIAASQSGYLNLIHVDDAAAAVDLAIQKGRPPRTYNVSDGAPVNRGDYYREVAMQIGASEPRFDLSVPNVRTSRASADKRVSNARIVSELGFVPSHKNYQEGIAASLAE